MTMTQKEFQEKLTEFYSQCTITSRKALQSARITEKRVLSRFGRKITGY